MSENISNQIEGLKVGSKVPIIELVDVYKNPINLEDLLETHKGILIDFFRGIW